MTMRTHPIQRDRGKLYGSEMTARETLKHLHRTYPLTFRHRVSFEEPFTSATGTTRSKTALVFSNGTEDVLFTEGEVRTLIEFGLDVPPEAFKIRKKSPVKRGLGGLL